MAALRRAVALADPHAVAVGVGDDLHLHVPGPGEVALDVALRPAEALQRLGLRRLERRRRLFGGLHDAHAAAAAPVGRLDGDRPAVGLAEGDDLVGRREELGGAGDAGNARFLRGDAARHLVAHHLDRLGRRPDERDAACGDGPGEVGVLREEPVARVDRLGARPRHDLEDLVGVQVALGRRPTSEGVGLVGEPHVEGVAVEFGVDRDGGHPQLLAGADHPDGDLAPVGDEDLGEHGCVTYGTWLATSKDGSPREPLC